MMTPGQYFLIGMFIAMAAYGAIRPGEYLLNGRAYATDVAPPYANLPVLSREYGELLQVPNSNDILGYVTSGTTVDCHIVNGSLLHCSNGLEVSIYTQTVQQVFQIMAESHALLNTPQLPPDVPLFENREMMRIDILVPKYIEGNVRPVFRDYDAEEETRNEE